MNHQYNPTIHHRRSIRLQGYNYAQAGAYFVTICSQQKAHLFGEIIEGKMALNECGHIINQIWHELPQHYANISLAEFVIMPNHIHGVIVLTENISVRADIVRAGLKPAPTHAPTKHGLSEIIRGFKTFSARRINQYRNAIGVPVWHRNYYEHIIRNDTDYQRIAEYIVNNPQKWAEDSLNVRV
jgi:REP element-mobilizing transposase RayT